MSCTAPRSARRSVATGALRGGARTGGPAQCRAGAGRAATYVRHGHRLRGLPSNGCWIVCDWTNPGAKEGFAGDAGARLAREGGAPAYYRRSLYVVDSDQASSRPNGPEARTGRIAVLGEIACTPDARMASTISQRLGRLRRWPAWSASSRSRRLWLSNSSNSGCTARACR